MRSCTRATTSGSRTGAPPSISRRASTRSITPRATTTRRRSGRSSRRRAPSDPRAFAHCMGSASLTMSVLAGKAKQLRTVVSSAVSYDIELAELSKRRLGLQLWLVSRFLAGTDPQWAARAPSLPAALLSAIGRLRRDYPNNPLVAATTYIYGGEVEALWMRSEPRPGDARVGRARVRLRALLVLPADEALREGGAPGPRRDDRRLALEPGGQAAAPWHLLHVPRGRAESLLPARGARTHLHPLQRGAARACTTGTGCSRATATTTC